MEFLEALLAGIVTTVAIVIGLTMIGGLVLAFWGLKKKKRAMVAVGLVTAAAPLLLYWNGKNAAKNELEQRQAAIAAIATVPMPADYPRILIIDGPAYRLLVAALMADGYFDEAVAEDRGDQATWFYFAHQTPDCVTHAKAFFNDTLADGNFLADCVATTGGAPYQTADAVILRIGQSRTQDGGSQWMNGAVEVLVRRGGVETTIAYEETPYITEPMGVFTPYSRVTEGEQGLNPPEVFLRAFSPIIQAREVPGPAD